MPEEIISPAPNPPPTNDNLPVTPEPVMPGSMTNEQAMEFLKEGTEPNKPPKLTPAYSEIVLLALINNFEQNKWMLDELSEEHFGTFGSNQAIFRAILAVEKAGEVVGMPTVLARFPDGNDLNGRAFTEGYLKKWMPEYEKCTNLRSEVNALQRQLKYLKIMSVLNSGKDDIESREKEPHAVAIEIANKLDGLSATVEIPTVSQQELNALMLGSLTIEPPPAYSTGFAELDKRIGGLTPKRTYVIGARTGQGKSAFLLNLLASLGRQSIKSAFISLEMDQLTMNKRLSCIVGGIESSHLKYRLSNETLAKVKEVQARTDKWPIYWSDKRGMTLVDLRTKLSQFARMGCKVVFVDYIQRVVVGNREPKNIQVGMVAKTLADLADRLNIAVVVASQMNREGSKSETGPELHNIAESTVIEESADVIILLSYKRKEDETQGRNRPVRINIAKNRHGFGGSYDMYFCGREFKFSDTPFERMPSQTPHPAGVPTSPVTPILNIPPAPMITAMPLASTLPRDLEAKLLTSK